MANNREKHAISAASLAIGTVTLFDNGELSKTAQTHVDRIQERGHAAIDALPHLTPKEARSVSRRVEALGDMLKEQQVNGVALSSFLLAILELSVDSTHCKELERLFVAVRGLHNYYDRQLKHHTEYAYGGFLADQWSEMWGMR